MLHRREKHFKVLKDHSDGVVTPVAAPGGNRQRAAAERDGGRPWGLVGGRRGTESPQGLRKKEGPCGSALTVPSG